MKFGVDVACTRADDLDKAQLTYIATCTQPLVVDIGCGKGGQSARLATAGARVIGVDVHDYSSSFAALRASLQKSETELCFMHGVIEQVVARLNGPFDSISLQRVVHYIEPSVALEVLQVLRLQTNGTLYMSVTGCESAIGVGCDCTQPLTQRMSTLPADLQETFSITAPICPYTKEECEQLVTTAGWQIEQSWTSAFGNHKLIATSL